MRPLDYLIVNFLCCASSDIRQATLFCRCGCLLWLVRKGMAMVGQRPRRVEVTAAYMILVIIVVVVSDLSNCVRAEKSVSAFVQNAILSNKIVIFSKSYCPYVCPEI